MKRITQLIERTIKLLTKLKNIMNSDTEISEKIYVWSKSESAGKIVKVSPDQPGGKWLYFTDGTRINSSLVNEYLIEAVDENDAKHHASSFGNSIGLTSPKTGPVEDNTNTAVTNTTEPVNLPKEEVKEEVNVMMEMLSKMSRKNKAEMPVKVNIPSKTVYEMLQDQMDLEPKDLNEQIGMLVENQINNLQEQLREQIQSFISNYYTNE